MIALPYLLHHVVHIRYPVFNQRQFCLQHRFAYLIQARVAKKQQVVKCFHGAIKLAKPVQNYYGKEVIFVYDCFFIANS
jgi:hypothetical protein